MPTILIIEDDEPILATYAYTLEKAGYRALTAPNGVVGLDIARQYLPDVVLCDLNMPEMDGWGALRALRDDPDLAATQVVLMTGNNRAASPRSGMELGADDFLEKPFGQHELLRCVEARLRRAGIHRRITDKAVADLRASLHSNLPHEFFTPLAGILGLVEVLKTEGQNMPAPETAEILNDIQRSGWSLHRTLRNYLYVLELEGNAKPPEAAPVIPPERVRAAVNAGIQAAAKRRQRSADIVTDLAPCSISGFLTDLMIIAEELVDNACGYSPTGTPVRVELTSSGVLSVKDHGRGLSESQKRQVGAFRQFDRRRYEQQGLGVGLFLVNKLADRCNASFHIESASNSGTTALLDFETVGAPT